MLHYSMVSEINLSQHNSTGASKAGFNDDPLSCERIV